MVDILDLAEILSTVFAGASVLVAIFLYRKNSEREYFSNIRRSLVRYRCLIDEANESFDEIGLVEVSASISDKLRLICPSEYTTSQIQEFFYDEGNTDFIRQAIYLGLGESKTIKRAKQITTELGQLNSEFIEPFPISKVTLGILSSYYSAIVNTVSSGDLIDSIFEAVRDGKEEHEPQSEENLLHPDLVFRQMAIYITILHVDFLNNHGDRMLEQVDEISEIITHYYESKSDSELRKISKQEKKEFPVYDNAANSISDGEKVLFEYLKFYKPDLDSEIWDNLVEAKALLESATSEASEEE